MLDFANKQFQRPLTTDTEDGVPDIHINEI